MLAALAGLATGLIHVLAGPDHLAAVAPLAADETRPQWKAGVLWGAGHTAGVCMVGVLFLAFRGLLPIEAISAWSERIVGLALIAVGVWGVRRARRLQVHHHASGTVHAHERPGRARSIDHDEEAHRHQHIDVRLHGHARSRVSFAMGTLHGLAGSSHLFGVLPALAFPTTIEAAGYLAGFGVGAILAMTGFAGLVGLMASGASRRSALAYQSLLYACSVGAVAVGGVWLAIS
jgi:ABC-type nickel/cobalt efflux system permease component RcnA